MYTTKAVKRTALALMMASIGTSAMAAGTDTGVQAGFYALGQDLATIVAGAGGYVIMLLSVIIGGVTLAVTGRWGQVAIAVGVRHRSACAVRAGMGGRRGCTCC